MRRTVAIVLVVALSSGCATNRKRTVFTSPSPPRAAEEVIVGVVLSDGAEVGFLEPAVVEADGTVRGSVAVRSETAPQGALVARTVTYEPGQIAGYLVAGEESESGSIGTLGSIVLVAAGAFGLLMAAWYLTCDDDDFIC